MKITAVNLSEKDLVMASKGVNISELLEKEKPQPSDSSAVVEDQEEQAER